MPRRNQPCPCDSGQKYKKCCGAAFAHGLHRATAENDVAAVQRAIAAGVDVNNRNNSGGTPLYVAAQEGHVDVCQCLINAAADVDAQFSDPRSGATPLSISAFKGFESVVRCLLRATAEVNKTTYAGVSALHAACGQGHLGIARCLIKQAAEVNLTESMGMSSPLHVATEYGHASIVRLLIKHGAVERPMLDTHNRKVQLVEELTKDQATLELLAEQRCATCKTLCRVKRCLSCKVIGYCSVRCQVSPQQG